MDKKYEGFAGIGICRDYSTLLLQHRAAKQQLNVGRGLLFIWLKPADPWQTNHKLLGPLRLTLNVSLLKIIYHFLSNPCT